MLVLFFTPGLVILFFTQTITHPTRAEAPRAVRANADPVYAPLIFQGFDTEPTRLAFPTKTPAVPCSDSRGCPDLVVDGSRMSQWDVITRTPVPCDVAEGYAQPGLNVFLRFAAKTPNIGNGSLILGNPSQNPSWFEYAPCHNHWHLKEYADYRLWTPQGYQTWIALRVQYPNLQSSDLLNAYPDLRAQMIQGYKFSFCVVDTEWANVPGAPTPDPLTFVNCNSSTGNQGISRGWADVYAKGTAGQWFEVRDIPSGVYVIEEEVNAEHFFRETNYVNNSAFYTVTIPNLGIPTRTPTATPTSPSFNAPQRATTPTPTPKK